MIKTILKKIGLKYGLIGGVASVVVSLIIFYALKGHSPYPIQKLLSNITTAVFMTLGIYAYKYSIAERPLRLPQAFLSGAIVVLVSVVTSALLFYISLKLLPNIKADINQELVDIYEKGQALGKVPSDTKSIEDIAKLRNLTAFDIALDDLLKKFQIPFLLLANVVAAAYYRD